MADKEEKLAKIEAILFVHGEPLARKRLAQLIESSAEETEALLREYAAALAAGQRGLALLMDGEKAQLVTKPQFHQVIETFIKEQLTEDLTPAALETLAIIAYFGPISRQRIEYQRGVNSIFTLRGLLLRGLIERQPDPNQPSYYLYQPSFELWKHLGLTGPADLPEIGKFQELLAKFEAQPHD